MYADVENVTPSKLYSICTHIWESEELIEKIMTFANWSDPLLVVSWNECPLVIIGIVPDAILSGSGYIWAQETPTITKYSFVVARSAVEILRAAKLRYPNLRTHAATKAAEHGWKLAGGVCLHRVANTTFCTFGDQHAR